ncbi:MAG: alpha/beta fold hydrolase, partial [Desulfovibrionales bacterium]|nr:alpha/beta fold hydrolase [Desulfovibrionales bacterium]
KKQVWSLATQELFQIPSLEKILHQLGAVSVHDPNRDDLILETLLSGKFHWVVFPEGMMVKNKKLVDEDRFFLKDGNRVRMPRTGAAFMALRCAFFRERLRRLQTVNPLEFDRLASRLKVDNPGRVLSEKTHIVPVNITYYPANPRKNILGSIAQVLLKEPSKRMMDELLTEGAMLLSGVDITIRFGPPIDIASYLHDPYLESMLSARRPIRFSGDWMAKDVTRKLCQNLMREYMTGVYSLTTLNYDHVMACILKHLPYKKKGVDPEEFRCKVYYAISVLASSQICHLSHYFKGNQIHLLIDDRYGRIETFLSLARETGVLIERDGHWEKNQDRFSDFGSFHAVRMENPVMVMANEVEPLREVEVVLKKIAQRSMPRIMELVNNGILSRMRVGFTTDYIQYYKQGETKKKQVGMPIFLRRKNPRAGVLLVHGYLAAPEEMRGFARYLYNRGYSVFCPRLKGHGTAPEDLARTTHQEWMEAVEEAYVVLRHTCSKVVIGGFSTGAGLALELATRVSDYTAVFAVAPPMQLKVQGASFVPAINAWNSMIKKINLDTMAKEFVTNTPENPHINYSRNPVAGTHQLDRLMQRVGGRLDQIKKPALLAQSRTDPVVHHRGCEKLYDRLGSRNKELYLFDMPRHGILVGEGAERVYGVIEMFINQWI